MKFKFWVEVSGRGEAIVEIPDSDLQGLSDAEQQRLIADELDHWTNEHVTSGWVVVEGDLTALAAGRGGG